jgi:predicted dehydrogenase
MVLCRERNDYTIIHVNNYRFDLAVQELKEILESRGEIIDLQYVHGEGCYQCWVRERYSEDMDIVLNNIDIDWKPQVWMFLLFEAGDFVVETAE